MLVQQSFDYVPAIAEIRLLQQFDRAPEIDHFAPAGEVKDTESASGLQTFTHCGRTTFALVNENEISLQRHPEHDRRAFAGIESG